MKIIITEEQFNILKETISPSEAYNSIDSILTIINGKRGVGFITMKGETKKNLLLIKRLINRNGLKTIKVPYNPCSAYIIYKEDYFDDAIELLNIAEKYDGYLSSKATKKDTIRIGQLLGYNDIEIEEYVRNKYGV